MSKRLRSSLFNIGVSPKLFTEECKEAFIRNCPQAFKGVLGWKEASDPQTPLRIEDETYFFLSSPMQQESKDYVMITRIVAQLRDGRFVGSDCEKDELFERYLQRKGVAENELFALLHYCGSLKRDRNDNWIVSANYYIIQLLKPDTYFRKLRRKIEEHLRTTTTAQLLVIANDLGIKP